MRSSDAAIVAEHVLRAASASRDSAAHARLLASTLAAYAEEADKAADAWDAIANPFVSRPGDFDTKLARAAEAEREARLTREVNVVEVVRRFDRGVASMAKAADEALYAAGRSRGSAKGPDAGRP